MIPSPRHTDADLVLWAEHVEADKTHLMSDGFFERCQRVKTEVKRYDRRHRRYYLATSWGKDSVVMLHFFWSLWCRPKVIYVRQLDNENPESVRVRDAFLRRYDFPDYEEVAYSYRDADPSWFKDGRPDRWYQVLRRLQKEYGAHVTGIRSDESARRKRRCCVFGTETIHTFAPLSWFTVRDVYAYMQLHNLPVHPNYAMLGGGRWPRDRVRVAAVGNVEGTGIGRREWEREYYGDVLRRLEATR